MEADGERNRVLYVIKSRGMSHSNQMREYRITNAGIELVDAYVGPNGVLTGHARINQEAGEQAAAHDTARRSPGAAARSNGAGRR